jgi:hypothetical protein
MRKRVRKSEIEKKGRENVFHAFCAPFFFKTQPLDLSTCKVNL